MSDYAGIASRIGAATGSEFVVIGARHVGGGCINDAVVLSSARTSYFVKLNDAPMLPMFEAEAEGLAEIGSAHAIRAPQPVVSGVDGGRSFLVLEHIPLGSTGSAAELGKQLARMHRHTASQFGWHRDNTIGSTPQPNQRSDNWVDFWREQRLGYQLDLAARHGEPSLKAQAQNLLQALPQFFSEYSPQPSLLHGDLWGGNYGYDDRGQPVIYDPAVYYGDREADIAMTELFGGFGAGFYDAYNASYPLDSGYAGRKTLYNLYHILNHFNLFGGGYANQALAMIQRLSALL